MASNDNMEKKSKVKMYAVVPRLSGTPMPSHASFVVALAMLSGASVPTVVAYPITKAPLDGFMHDMTVTPLRGDFARCEEGAWHLADDFRTFEEMGSVSYIDGMAYAGFAERAYLSPLDSADGTTAFEWLIDLDTLPVTHDRDEIPAEIEALVAYINQREQFGTPLFPYIACSMSRARVAMMHGRYSSEPKATEPAHVSSRSATAPAGNGGKAWHWDLYDSLGVLVDADGHEVLEFDEDQMLVRRLPGGRPVTTFSDRRSVANREADRRGLRYDGPLDSLMQERRPGIDQHLYVDYPSWSGMRWTRHGNLYALRDVNDEALLGLDLGRMRIHMANGTFADCVGDPGGMFETALHLTEIAKNAIGATDVTGMPAGRAPATAPRDANGEGLPF